MAGQENGNNQILHYEISFDMNVPSSPTHPPISQPAEINTINFKNIKKVVYILR